MEDLKNIDPATPESIWAILRETAALQKKTEADFDKFQAEYAARQAEYDARQAASEALQETFQKAHEQRQAEYDARQARSEALQKEFQKAHEQRQAENEAWLKKSRADFDARQKEYDARREKADNAADRRLARLAQEVGGMSKNNGLFAEEYFYNALNASRTYGNIKYDAVTQNMVNSAGKVAGEYDVVMLNGSSVAIIEVKYRVHKNFPEKLATLRVKKFRKLYPRYAQHKIYLGIAGFSFDEMAVANAKQLGIGLVKPQGDTIECDTEHIKAY
jgi:hypothetical protein